MTSESVPPAGDEIEVTLIGPGYGECVLLHTGDGRWVVVDSCVDGEARPAALTYLEGMDVDPARAVDLIVATHWHDDHIRGMAALVAACRTATFCCSAALRDEEFLAAIHALESRPVSHVSYGVKEIHSVLTRLVAARTHPKWALADRQVLARGACTVRALSPSDETFQNSLLSVGRLVREMPHAKRRVPGLSPNHVAVVLWVEMADAAVLLGADLERRGWTGIVESRSRRDGQASVFKIPHHGGASAHEPRVWARMLRSEPFAILTPWRVANRRLPTPDDAGRILSLTSKAYITASPSTGAPRRRRAAVIERTVRHSRPWREQPLAGGAVRLRRPVRTGADWTLDLFGSARHLKDVA